MLKQIDAQYMLQCVHCYPESILLEAHASNGLVPVHSVQLPPSICDKALS